MSKISIIVCTRRAQLPAEMQQNIAATIGCDYELVVIDNSNNKYSIFEAYNIGVSRATGDLLCFVHDDVLFRTDKWGAIIGEIFTDETIGMVGFAGSHFMPQCPMYWWDSPYVSQYNLDSGCLQSKLDYFNGMLADVVVVDGLCFFTKKSLFDTIRFDEKLYSGFHAYDMDICMQVQKMSKRVCVTNAILVEHFWNAELFNNKAYMAKLEKNMTLFYKKWESYMPITRGLEEPPVVLTRVNRLCMRAYDAKVARNSVSYKLGRLILSPIKWLQSKLR